MSYRDEAKNLYQRMAALEERLRQVSTSVVTTRVTSDHGSLSGLGDDDHGQYQKESEKSTPGGYASLDGTGVVPDAELPANLLRVGDVDTEDIEMLVWLSMADA